MAYVTTSRFDMTPAPDFWDYATNAAVNSMQAQQQADAEYKKMLMDNLLGPSMKALIDKTIDEFRKQNGRLPNAQELTDIIQGTTPIIPPKEQQPSLLERIGNFFKGFGGNNSASSPPSQSKPQPSSQVAPSAPSPIVMQTFDRLGAQTTGDYVIAQTPEGRTYKVPLARLDENAIKELVSNGVTFPKPAPSYPSAPSTFGPTAQEGRAYVNQPKVKELKKKETQDKARKAYEIVRKGLFGINTPNIM